VVDDEPRLRQVLVRVLAREGFECRDANDGAEALRVLESWPVPLVMTDLACRTSTAWSCCARVRARHPDTAVVMVTAVADVDTAVRCLGMGAADYLTKPFHLDEVRARVRQALSRRRLVLDNRRYQRGLEDRVADQARQLERLFLASVASLADALEVRTPYTRGHSLRVGPLRRGGRAGRWASTPTRSAAGARRPPPRPRQDRRARGRAEQGGPLTDDEYRHVMQHPVIGWRLLQPLLEDAPLALAMVRWHHERHDGRGGPGRARRRRVRSCARIAAVADSFDAMTSHRPYRRGLGLGDAVDELRRNAGTQFDPAAVAAFEQAVADGAVTLDE
jgi:response regulator RpfG family c-di-GMP phosphodiesterase